MRNQIKTIMKKVIDSQRMFLTPKSIWVNIYVELYIRWLSNNMHYYWQLYSLRFLLAKLSLNLEFAVSNVIAYQYMCWGCLFWYKKWLKLRLHTCILTVHCKLTIVFLVLWDFHLWFKTSRLTDYCLLWNFLYIKMFMWW
jgi:hypothetical protein